MIADAADDGYVEVEHLGDRAIVCLADPDKRNVLSAPMMIQLIARAGELVRDPAIRAIVLTGSGSGFSTGGDLRLMQRVTESLGTDEDVEGAFSPYQFIRYQFGAMVRLIARSDKAFIAALNGPAAGVGLAFALTCDIFDRRRGRDPRAGLRAPRAGPRGWHELGADTRARLPPRVRVLRGRRASRRRARRERRRSG